MTLNQPSSETPSDDKSADSSPYQIPIATVTRVRSALAHLFDTVDTRYDYPEQGQFRLRGKILYDLDQPDHFDEVIEIFDREGFTPRLTAENGRHTLTALPFSIEEQQFNWHVPLLLFLATIATTLLAGAQSDEIVSEALSAAANDQEAFRILFANMLRGWPYMLSIMLILGAHELGHYFAARYHKIPASLPFFIPMFPSPIGTMGAFIMQRGPSKNIRTQFDIGASGPLAGLVFAIPILIYGLATSSLGGVPTEPYMLEGNSILYMGLKVLIFGEMLPNAAGTDVFLNQFAWAGWTGLLVTGLNLIPSGQLDGGRVLQVLVGEDFLRQTHLPIIFSLILLGAVFATPMWFIWAGMLYFFGDRYDRPLDQITKIDPTRRALAIFTMVIFFFVFMPIPLQTVFP